MRVFAFGDVHGRADLLGELQRMIDDDVATRPTERSLVVGLGDYVDRGPDSYGVLELLRSLGRHHETIFLAGNHEAFLLDFVSDPGRTGRAWLRNGGWETLRSYQVDCSPNARSDDVFVSIRDAFLDRLPEDHLALLEAMTMAVTIGDHFFVHAGARPGVPLTELPEKDALWIREGFADRDAPFEKVVVHGHSPVTNVFVGMHRINLDTGAYATGKLSCIVLEGNNRRFLESGG